MITGVILIILIVLGAYTWRERRQSTALGRALGRLNTFSFFGLFNRNSRRPSSASDAWDYQDIRLSYLHRRGSDSANVDGTSGRGRTLTEETSLTTSPEDESRKPESTAVDVEAAVNSESNEPETGGKDEEEAPEVTGSNDEELGAVGGSVAMEEIGRRREGEVTVEVRLEPPPAPARQPKVSSTRSSNRFPRSSGARLTPLIAKDDADEIVAVAEVSL